MQASVIITSAIQDERLLKILNGQGMHHACASLIHDYIHDYIYNLLLIIFIMFIILFVTNYYSANGNSLYQPEVRVYKPQSKDCSVNIQSTLLFKCGPMLL